MDNVKDDRYYLHKILEDLEFLIAHNEGKTYKDIEADPVLIDCIMFRLIQIAENSDKLNQVKANRTRSEAGISPHLHR